MQNAKIIIISIATLLLIGTFILVGYLLGHNNNDISKTIEYRDSIKVYLPETIYITDTLYKTNRIKEYVEIPIANSIDSTIYKQFDSIRVELEKRNINSLLTLDSLVKNNNRTDSIRIECNKIKNSITFQLRYGLQKDTTKYIKETIYDNSFHFKEFTYGAGSMLLLYGILKLTGIIKW